MLPTWIFRLFSSIILVGLLLNCKKVTSKPSEKGNSKKGSKNNVPISQADQLSCFPDLINIDSWWRGQCRQLSNLKYNPERRESAIQEFAATCDGGAKESKTVLESNGECESANRVGGCQEMFGDFGWEKTPSSSEEKLNRDTKQPRILKTRWFYGPLFDVATAKSECVKEGGSFIEVDSIKILPLDSPNCDGFKEVREKGRVSGVGKGALNIGLNFSLKCVSMSRLDYDGGGSLNTISFHSHFSPYDYLGGRVATLEFPVIPNQDPVSAKFYYYSSLPGETEGWKYDRRNGRGVFLAPKYPTLGSEDVEINFEFNLNSKVNKSAIIAVKGQASGTYSNPASK